MAGLDPAIQELRADAEQAALDGRLKGGHGVKGAVTRDDEAYFGARLARIRCSVRRCMLSRRAVSETLRLHSSYTR